MSGEPPVEYIELNLSNYDAEDVSQLNEWAIWASGEIERLRTNANAAKVEAYDDVLAYLNASKRLVESEPHYTDPVKQASVLAMRISVDSVLQFVEQRRRDAAEGGGG